MHNPINQLRVNAVLLLRQPGRVATVAATVAPADLDIDDDRVDGLIAAEFEASATTDSVVVDGSVSVPWTAPCRRCATQLDGVARAEVREWYQPVVTDPEAFALDGDTIDLAPVVRQYALLELPNQPLCRPDCAGLCAQCGADLNDSVCDCVVDDTDPRWAALEAWSSTAGDAESSSSAG